MKAITLWQPWASLVALGAKTIETRSWSTKYRGQLVIHAAKSTHGFDVLPGDCEGTTEAGWRYGYVGDFQASYCYRTSDEGTEGEAELHDLGPGGPSEPTAIPLGKIVAVCELVDCVPILGVGEVINARPPAIPPFVVDTGPLGGALCLGTPESMPAGVNIEEQRPFGDFTPGRYAWLLENVRELEPIDVDRGHQGLWNHKGCDICFGWCERAGGYVTCPGPPES